jgi:hypothetical protein
MKNALLIALAALVAVITLAVGAGAIIAIGTSPAGKAVTTASAVTSPFPIPPAVTAPEPEITKAEFDQLTDGMTEDQVVAIVGSPGKVVGEYVPPPQYAETASRTVNYEGGALAYCSITYMGGKLFNKSQAGLK